MLNTHRSTCFACNADVILRPGTPEGTATNPARLDAIATVARGAAAQILPLLPPLVVWECPACDTRQS